MPPMGGMPPPMSIPAVVGLFCKKGPLPMSNLDIKVEMVHSLVRVVLV
jgi:hypothetical protein